jgi:phosphoesterase RecJ-like protein
MTENDIEHNALKVAAPKILELIKASNSILLHCHIFPDCDSIGSALAMKFALEQLGKKVTVIRGDSAIPEVFAKLPGAGEIVPKNFLHTRVVKRTLCNGARKV